jgi:hypothetical protein
MIRIWIQDTNYLRILRIRIRNTAFRNNNIVGGSKLLTRFVEIKMCRHMLIFHLAMLWVAYRASNQQRTTSQCPGVRWSLRCVTLRNSDDLYIYTSPQS